jgi:hypothetical protein
MTVRTSDSSLRWSTPDEIRTASSDSGVVSNKSGGSRRTRWRAAAPTSPCHRAARRPDHRGVSLDPRCQVIKQGAQRADVKCREPIPIFDGHAREKRKERRFGLAARRRRKKQGIVAGLDWPYCLKLSPAEVGPPEGVDHVVPERRVELLEGAHGSNATSSTDDTGTVARSAAVISRSSRVGA